MLYVVATPIGNLKDMTFRAVEVLKEVDLILAEDTRTSSVLMRAYDIKNEMRSFHKFNERGREEEILDLLEGGQKIALISDAGTPGICDPGARLIRKCRKSGVKVEVLPGPCAVVAALSLYGSEEHFQFVGFLEKKGKKQLIDIVYYPGLTIAYESPHHLMKTLEWMNEIAPQSKIFIARELTKLYEETLEGTPQELIKHFQERKTLGEYVLIFSGNQNPFEKEPSKLVEELQERFGINPKEALVAAAKLLNKPKRELYDDLHRNDA
ncbi:MAG: 16S rRNA (cytidine(1402)-2'-O)-methyltransferase [Simkaniaceae bacterium]|nr:MAG: 16S rRNA (cytidine(1402)-2'-O)-methyltransferase [Simkaniaceae bacterium]